jgi:hypothetical protein
MWNVYSCWDDFFDEECYGYENGSKENEGK